MRTDLIAVGVLPLMLTAGGAWADEPKVAKTERLVRATGQRYLGWQVSKVTFRTCSGKDLSIDDSKIETTHQSCPETPPLHLVYKDLQVLWVDANARTVGIGEGGKVTGHFYPMMAEKAPGGVSIENVKPGDTMRIGKVEDSDFWNDVGADRIEYMANASRRLPNPNN